MVKVISYNVHHFEGLDGEDKINQVAEYLQNNQADFVLFQEIDFSNSRSNFKDQLKIIAELSRYKFSFAGKILNYKDGYYGLGILSKHPISNSKVVILPILATGMASDTLGGSHKVEQRGYMTLESDVEGRRIKIINSHFSMWPEERRDAFEKIKSEFTEDFVIFAADFNTVDEREFKLLEKYKTQNFNTFQLPKPSKPIDRFFVKGFRNFKTEVGSVNYSDHLPVILEVEF